MVLVTPLSPKPEDFSKPVDTSSQVGAPDDAKMDDLTPEHIHATSFPTVRTPGPSGNIPPLDITHLWEEANKALGDWLVIKSSIDAHQHKLVSKFGMTLPQNKSKTKESIKEAKALCTHSIREVEANCAYSIKEAEGCCPIAIREAETQGASQASSIQQSHVKDVQHLEEGAIEEESKGQLVPTFLCYGHLQPLWGHSLLPCGLYLGLPHLEQTA